MSLGLPAQPELARPVERGRHVRRVHEAELRHDAPEAVLRASSTSIADRRIDRRHVDDRHREQDDLLVQHLVVRQMVHEDRRRALGPRGHENAGARHAHRRLARATLSKNRGSGTSDSASRRTTSCRPVCQVDITAYTPAATSSGNQPPCCDLDHVGAEEREVDDEEGAGHDRGAARRSTPRARARRRTPAAS